MGGQKNTGFVWTPTKRRGPIAAEFSTPGPAAIGLPSTFGQNVSVKSRSPAFSISGRFENKLNSASPGPGQYNINGISYKAGKDEPHAPSMHIRPKDPKPFVTPAPGDYCPEKSQRVLDQAPKFSFGVKTDNGNVPDVPGPGTYSEAVVDKYKTVKSPAFSMGQRTNIPSDHTRKPGPGAHSPEKCMQDDGPSWTMAPRLEDIKKMNVPGPGTYESGDLDMYLEKRPVYSMRPKTELPRDKTPKPSPNAYNPEKYNHDEGPKWTLATRLVDPKGLNVPGPGTYEAGELDVFQDKQPVYSMRPKTELPRDKTPKPSPNAYRPEEYNPDEGPKWTLAQRLAEFKRMKVPGPGSYEAGDLDTTLEKRPAYTMRPKTELPTDKTPKPSPNAYEPEKYNPDEGPKWTLAQRLAEFKRMKVPGPGSYEAGDLDATLEKRPVYSMRPKTELPTDKTPKPSPNAYRPEKYNSDEGPKWTLAQRLAEFKRMQIPGPGSYESGDLDATLEKRPVYSMRPKTELPTDKGPRPSPNAYNPEKCMPDDAPKWTMAPRTELPSDKTPKPAPNAYDPDEAAMAHRNPEFSFGIKHSKYLGKLRDQ